MLRLARFQLSFISAAGPESPTLSADAALDYDLFMTVTRIELLLARGYRNREIITTLGEISSRSWCDGTWQEEQQEEWSTRKNVVEHVQGWINKNLGPQES